MLTMNRLALLGSACLIASVLSHCGGGSTTTPDMSQPDMAMGDMAQPKPAPTIDMISPASASTAGGGMLTITGTNFQTGATVTVGGTACSNPTVTATQITCTIPAKAMGCGAAAIVVTNPDMQSVSQGTGFAYRTATVTYAAAVNTMATGAFPRRVIAVDLSGDMRPELITANQNGNNASVFLNNGMGAYAAAATNLATAGATDITAVAVGDVNGDGKPDLVTANGATGNVTLYLGAAGGTFGTGTNFVAGATPNSLALADLNNDQKLDLAVSSSGAGTVNILLANAQGTAFGAPSLITVAGSTGMGDVALVDLDADNKPELIMTSRNQNNVTVYQGMGGASFMNMMTYSTGANTNPYDLTVVDINGDGKLDVVTANTNGNNVSVLLGTGNRAFGTAAPFGTANTPETVAVADMNNDGILDILTANAATNNISYLQGMGNNTYANVVNRAAGMGAAGMVVADLNGDGLRDVAVASTAGNNVGVSLQQCQ